MLHESRLWGLIAAFAASAAIAGCGSGSASSQASLSHASAAGNPTSKTTASSTRHASSTSTGHAATTTSTTIARSLITGAPSRGKSSRKPVAAGGPNTGRTSSYFGSGNGILAELKLARDAVLHWTTSGGQFALTDDSRRLKISGHGTSGQGFVAAGDYKQVHVTALGQWKLRVQLLGTP